jgi:hypothetical protein
MAELHRGRRNIAGVDQSVQSIIFDGIIDFMNVLQTKNRPARTGRLLASSLDWLFAAAEAA